MLIVASISLVGSPIAFADVSLGVNDDRALYKVSGNQIVTSGKAFDELIVKGGGVAAGGKVDIYWDIVAGWSDTTGTGYKATATATIT